MAKSRATFTMADLVKRDELLGKKRQILTLTVMMAVAQLFKLFAENNFGHLLTEKVKANQQARHGPNV